VDQTDRRHAELQRPRPETFFVYVDQGEELYVRAGKDHRLRFSQLIAEGLRDSRVRALMSLRSDFFGELQKDSPLYDAHQLISIPPLREPHLREIVEQPSILLAARFENEELPVILARRTAEESAEEAGALPLLSYLLDDMWKRMVEKGDGILRLPEQSIDLGRVLIERANAFISNQPQSEEAIRRIFTLKLATVRENGELTRRRAPRSEFSDDEWRLVNELANDPNRLLVTASPEIHEASALRSDRRTDVSETPAVDEAYAEVAHETIFRRWDRLRQWIVAERAFLTWRSGIEFARRNWQATPSRLKKDAVLRGFALVQAINWLAQRPDDIFPVDKRFILQSRNAQRWRRARVLAFASAVLVGFAGWSQLAWLKEQGFWLLHVKTLSASEEAAKQPKEYFQECANCPEMVVLPSGNFVMGGPPSGPFGRDTSEYPRHEVTIAQPFAVSNHEVTFEQWDTCTAYGDCRRGSCPVGWCNSGVAVVIAGEAGSIKLLPRRAA
jgi:hypothetical protein